MSFLLYVVLGVCAGTFAGLFGIGGGLLIVPALIFSFKLQGFAPDVLIHMAIGTSLATIAVTSTSSVIMHHKKGAVKWSVLPYMVLGIALGVWLGVITAIHLKGKTLQLILGLFVILVATNMLLNVRLSSFSFKRKSGAPLLFMVGSIIGWKSGILGIGGGMLSVPFLKFYGLPIKKAVATSAACGVPIAIVGAISNIVLGSGNPMLPEYSIGFVYWPAFAGIVLTSTVCARFGARLAHRLPAKTLHKYFATFLFVVGIKLLWPLI